MSYMTTVMLQPVLQQGGCHYKEDVGCSASPLTRAHTHTLTHTHTHAHTHTQTHTRTHTHSHTHTHARTHTNSHTHTHTHTHTHAHTHTHTHARTHAPALRAVLQAVRPGRHAELHAQRGQAATGGQPGWQASAVGVHPHHTVHLCKHQGHGVRGIVRWGGRIKGLGVGF